MIWPLSLNALLSCGYANMGKINFFPIFRVHFRGEWAIESSISFSLNLRDFKLGLISNLKFDS